MWREKCARKNVMGSFVDVLDFSKMECSGRWKEGGRNSIFLNFECAEWNGRFLRYLLM
jgi:hypothetical protein